MPLLHSCYKAFIQLGPGLDGSLPVWLKGSPYRKCQKTITVGREQNTAFQGGAHLSR